MTEFYVEQRVRVLEPSFNSHIWGWTATVIHRPGDDPHSISPRRYTIVLDKPRPNTSSEDPDHISRNIFVEPTDIQSLLDTTHSNWNER